MPWPYLDVEPRKYRLRILDASVSRSYNLTFQTSKGVKLPFHIIGTGTNSNPPLLVDYAKLKRLSLRLWLHGDPPTSEQHNRCHGRKI